MRKAIETLEMFYSACLPNNVIEARRIYESLSTRFCTSGDTDLATELAELDNILFAECDTLLIEEQTETNPHLLQSRIYALYAHGNADINITIGNYLGAIDKQNIFDHNEAYRIERARLASTIFDYIWAMPPTERTARLCRQLLGNPLVSDNERIMFVGATALTLCSFYSNSIITLLIELCNHSSAKIRARAYAGIYLSLLIHTQRWLSDKQAQRAFRQITDNEASSKILSHVMEAFEKTLATPIINQRITSRITRKLKDFARDANPIEADVYKIADDAEIEGTMMSMQEWIADGLDVLYSTFNNLKSYRFFGDVSAWLSPYDPNNPLLIDEMRNILSRLTLAAPELANKMTDSDKYSTALTLASIAEEKHLSEEETKELKDKFLPDESNDEPQREANTPESETITEAINFVRDLYRLLAGNNRFHFQNVIAINSDRFRKSEVFSTLFGKSSCLRQLIPYYLKFEHYNAASTATAIILSRQPDDTEMLYCSAISHYKARNYTDALRNIATLEIIDSNNLKAQMLAAQCHTKLGNKEQAASYLSALRQLPDNSPVIKKRIAQCYTLLHLNHDALDILYETEYFAPDNDIYYSIARNLFETNNISKCEQYLSKACGGGATPTAAAIILRGHTLLCHSNNGNAMVEYERASKLCGKETVAQAIMDDRRYLTKGGALPANIVLAYNTLT